MEFCDNHSIQHAAPRFVTRRAKSRNRVVYVSVRVGQASTHRPQPTQRLWRTGSPWTAQALTLMAIGQLSVQRPQSTQRVRRVSIRWFERRAIPASTVPSGQ
jgi:hypothetical protein